MLLVNEQVVQDFLLCAAVMEYVRPYNSLQIRTMEIPTNYGIRVVRWVAIVMLAFMALIALRCINLNFLSSIFVLL